MVYIMPCKETNALADLLVKSKTFKPKGYVSKKLYIIDYLSDYSDHL